ncbi:MAG: M91 family zinc metallopeptidase [Treponema sp.]|nr:M91 family zinc metallopeptidase [Treponema sp.]MEE3436066.1 M91 family zinc metallopeptidase [Treponema sp.]
MYAYAGNNPVRYIDPTGREIDISKDKNQKLILEAVQHLTDDVLCISDGKIIIKSCGNGSKTSGTKLLRYLISETNKTIKISSVKADGKNYSITQPFKVNENSAIDDIFNGQGLNSVVYWSMGEPIITEIDNNGNVCDKNCPAFISLGHELIHAYHNAKGENSGYMEYGAYFNMKEEYTTKFDSSLSENTLRGENGLNKRFK